MTATAAEALELALWLHRVPARRAALLGRPLPDGVGQLLRVAGGARDQVAAAARITGEDEATILEAVRFYLQQILFHDEADAYRVLGLRHDATPAQAREHHRLLQQWLHPDRHAEDAWETVYATRINRAWSHLKTPQSRAAYDAVLAAPPAQKPPVGAASAAMSTARPAPIQVATPPRHRSRNLTYLVLLACIGLLVLIALRQEQPPQWQDFRPSLAETTPPPLAENSDVDPFATLGAAMAAHVEASVPAPAPAPIETTMLAAPVPTAAAVPPRRPLAAAAMPVPAPAQQPPRPANAVAPAVRPARTIEQGPPTAAIVLPDDPLPGATGAAIATPLAPPAAPVAAVAAPAPTTPAVPPAPANNIPADAMARMTQARDRARQLSEYFADLGATAPPVWNDLRALRQAETLRTALHQRLGMPRRLALQLRDPQWRLNADGAWLDSGYRAAGEQGRLAIAFTWRADQLLVRSVDLVPDA